MAPDEQIGREPMYEAFADDFAAHAADGFYNAHYDRPACLSLLGDVAGRVVLDAGCGPGLYAAELVSCGARVIGFDISPRMIEICQARVSPAAGEFRVHALGDPLDWLADASVDLALCALSLEPRPVPAAAGLRPGDYGELIREPRGFIAFRLVSAHEPPSG